MCGVWRLEKAFNLTCISWLNCWKDVYIGIQSTWLRTVINFFFQIGTVINYRLLLGMFFWSWTGEAAVPPLAMRHPLALTSGSSLQVSTTKPCWCRLFRSTGKVSRRAWCAAPDLQAASAVSILVGWCDGRSSVGQPTQGKKMRSLAADEHTSQWRPQPFVVLLEQFQ